jgi:hypothetical protein
MLYLTVHHPDPSAIPVTTPVQMLTSKLLVPRSESAAAH